ncbi:MAG: FAD-dependent thymidylate synthase, partial [Terracidiphilus sp.]
RAVLELLKRRVQRPETVKPEAYERTLKARAFDVARYLLPLATNTSLGQIVNARTLETQISRLLSHPAAEVRDLGMKLRNAAAWPAWNVGAQAGQALVDALAARGTEAAEKESAEAAQLLTREVRMAPTLVKYAQPNEYLMRSREELKQAAREALAGMERAGAEPVVDLVERTEPLEVEIAATLLYSASHVSYRRVRDVVADWPEARVLEIVELGLRDRGKHDEALRVFKAGAALRFDILMDIGGFRDMHRHRRCVQILQEFTAEHGYETPGAGDLGGDADILAEAGIEADYRGAAEGAQRASARIAAAEAPEAEQSALYLLPLATRIRGLFKMDFAEAQYISELRTAPAGHFSYRRVAWEMYRAMERKHPALAKHIRVTDVREGIDLLQR